MAQQKKDRPRHRVLPCAPRRRRDSVPVPARGGAVAPPAQRLPLLGENRWTLNLPPPPDASFRARKNSSCRLVSLRSIKSRIISQHLDLIHKLRLKALFRAFQPTSPLRSRSSTCPAVSSRRKASFTASLLSGPPTGAGGPAFPPAAHPLWTPVPLLHGPPAARFFASFRVQTPNIFVGITFFLPLCAPPAWRYNGAANPNAVKRKDIPSDFNSTPGRVSAPGAPRPSRAPRSGRPGPKPACWTFSRTQTALEPMTRGAWFYAVHRGGTAGPGLVSPGGF